MENFIVANPFQHATEVVAGIDLSLSCPAICVVPVNTSNDITLPLSACQIYYLTDTRSRVIETPNIHGELMGSWSNETQRYESIADWAVAVVMRNTVVAIHLEAHALTTRNPLSFIKLVENAALLKYLLYKAAIPVMTIPPSVIKKFATGHGNAKKDQMVGRFEAEQGVNLRQLFGLKSTVKTTSPLHDIVDSYYIAMMARMNSVGESIIYNGIKA